MRQPTGRVAYTQVKNLAPSVKARPITGPLGPIPDVSVDGGGRSRGWSCAGTCKRSQEAAGQSVRRLTDLLTSVRGSLSSGAGELVR